MCNTSLSVTFFFIKIPNGFIYLPTCSRHVLLMIGFMQSWCNYYLLLNEVTIVLHETTIKCLVYTDQQWFLSKRNIFSNFERNPCAQTTVWIYRIVHTVDYGNFETKRGPDLMSTRSILSLWAITHFAAMFSKDICYRGIRKSLFVGNG